ncbi:hypothetical protein [Zymobacter palmae]|uniref:hypothetical protein n=1 Tax=Zymobacter palmae TaxID=33074 RepID=UPI00047FBF0F|nr:hypothetical protein [Zymobacter palmae]
MTRQELLTRLAAECETWPEALNLSMVFKDMFAYGSFLQQDWLAERKRLLNKPSWKDAPESATHLALDDISHRKWWFFYTEKPVKWPDMWMGDLLIGGEREAIAIPAGYDWRNSLEERP